MTDPADEKAPYPVQSADALATMWEATPELRFYQRAMPLRGHQAPELQTLWRNIWTGNTEWRPVPTVVETIVARPFPPIPSTGTAP